MTQNEDKRTKKELLELRELELDDVQRWRDLCIHPETKPRIDLKALLEKLAYTSSCLMSVYDGIEQDCVAEHGKQTIDDIRALVAVLQAFDTIEGIGTVVELVIQQSWTCTRQGNEALDTMLLTSFDVVMRQAITQLRKAGWEPDARSAERDLQSYREVFGYDRF